FEEPPGLGSLRVLPVELLLSERRRREGQAQRHCQDPHPSCHIHELSSFLFFLPATPPRLTAGEGTRTAPPFLLSPLVDVNSRGPPALRSALELRDHGVGSADASAQLPSQIGEKPVVDGGV